MPLWQAWLTWVSTTVTTITGSALIGMKYFLSPLDEFATVNHLWQRPMLKLHIVSAAVMLFAMGMVVANHALPYLKDNLNKARRTGLANLYTLAPMVMTGYLIQVLSEPQWLNAMAWAHIIASIVFCCFFGWHQFRAAPTRRFRIASWAAATILIISLIFLI